MATTGSFLGDIEAALIALLSPLVYDGPLDLPPMGMLRTPVRPVILPSDSDADLLIPMLKEQTPGAILSAPSFGVTYPLQSGWSDLPLDYRLIFSTDRAGASGLDQEQARRLDCYKFFDAAFALLYQAKLDIPSDSPIQGKPTVKFVMPQNATFVSGGVESTMTLFAMTFTVPIAGVAFGCREFQP